MGCMGRAIDRRSRLCADKVDAAWSVAVCAMLHGEMKERDESVMLNEDDLCWRNSRYLKGYLCKVALFAQTYTRGAYTRFLSAPTNQDAHNLRFICSLRASTVGPAVSILSIGKGLRALRTFCGSVSCNEALVKALMHSET